MKKLLLICVSVILTGNLLAGNYALGTHSEAGTPADPIPLTDVADLIKLSGSEADYGLSFILTTDIDMSGQTFNSIGHASAFFTGSIDGQNHVISNLTVTLRSAQQELGFIGYGSSCSVQNIGFTNVSIEAGAVSSGIQGGVGMVGFLNGSSSVSNCFVSGIVSARNGAGGIVGRLDESSTITNCMSNVTVNTYYDNRGGGIVGIVHNYLGSSADCITNCVFYGSLQKRGAIATLSGGIVGQVDTDLADVSIASNCYFNASSNGIVQPKNSNLTTIGVATSAADLRTQGTYSGLTFPTTWKMLTGGYAVLSSFTSPSFECTITPTIDGTGTGTISPAIAQTVALGEELTFSFTTSDLVSAVNLYGAAQTIDANPTSYTIDGVVNTSNLVVTFDGTTDISTGNMEDVTVYPNPSSGIFNIAGDVSSVEVYDITGKVVFISKSVGANEIDITNQSQGVYFVVATDSFGKTKTMKVVKQ